MSPVAKLTCALIIIYCVVVSGVVTKKKVSASTTTPTTGAKAFIRRSSSPFISVESWLEIALLSPNNVTFLNWSNELPAALANSTSKHTYVIANNHDYDSPQTLDIIRTIETHPLVRCVFAKNALYSSARLKLLPIGPKWQYSSHDFYAEDKEDHWRSLFKHGIGLKPPSQKELLSRRGILIGNMRPTPVRAAALESIKRNLFRKIHTIGAVPSSFEEHLVLLQHHKFVISPTGNGRDCHRHWEALLVGTVPIIERDSALMEAMDGLPVWWVDSYKEVTEDAYDLESTLLKENWSKANIRKLYTDWWAERIISSTCR